MKNILVFGITIVLISATGYTQQLRDNMVQNFRVERGVKSGQLTRIERSRVRKDQFRYKMEQKKARRDGVVTPGERRNLNMMKRKNNRQIFRMKHNRRNRVI